MQVTLRETFADPRFRRLFGAVSASRFGDGFKDVALAFAVLDISGSPTSLGLVLASGSLSMIGFLLLGGLFADRADRRRVMVAADLVRAGAQGSIAALLLTGNAEVWHLAVLQVGNGFGAAFFYPAATGLTPEIVPPERLQRANATLSFSGNTGDMAGPVLGGLLVAATSPGWGIAVDAATYLVSAAFLLGIGPTRRLALQSPRSLLADMADGWREVRTRSWLWATIVDSSVFQFAVFGTLFVLGPVVAREELGGAHAWGFVIGAFGGGTLVGSLGAYLTRPRRMLQRALFATLLTLPVLAALAIPAPLAAVVAAALAAGAGVAYSGTLFDVVLQQHVPRHALSRVAAWDWLGSTALRPLGFALAGPLAAAVGIGPTLVAAAVASGAVTLAAMSLQSVRKLETRPPAPAADAAR